MRTDPIGHHTPAPSSRARDAAELSVVQLIAELQSAGLVAVELDEDGEMNLILTGRGQKTARQMAMSKQGHALVLLGALVGTDQGPN